MRPVIFEIPLPHWLLGLLGFEQASGLPIHGYGLMIVIGFLLGTWVAGREAKRIGLPDFAYDLGLTMLLCGLLGGRVFYYVENYSEQFRHVSFLEFFKVWKGGLVFYGGAIGGMMGAFSYLFARKLPVLRSLDILAVGSPLAMAFGRLGCFMNGCCFGKLCETDFPLGVHFPVDSGAHRAHEMAGLIDARAVEALAVHPVQLYQSAHDLLLFVLVWWVMRRSGTPRGVGMPLLFLFYAVGRFCMEGLRADNPATPTGLTISQNVSILLGSVATACVIFLYFKAAKGRGRKVEENTGSGLDCV